MGFNQGLFFGFLQYSDDQFWKANAKTMQYSLCYKLTRLTFNLSFRTAAGCSFHDRSFCLAHLSLMSTLIVPICNRPLLFGICRLGS